MTDTVTLFWDFDNTLAYRDGMWTATLHQLLEENGIRHIARETISPYLQYGFPWHEYEIPHKDLFKGKTWWEFMEEKLFQVLVTLQLDQKTSDKIAAMFRSRYLDLQYWHLFEDTRKVLEDAQALGYANYILSNHTPELSMIVEGLGISDCFVDVFSSGLIGYEKPNSKMFRHVLEKVPQSRKMIMIGDNYNADICGAQSNGISGILVRSANKQDYEYYSSDLGNVMNIVSQM